MNILLWVLQVILALHTAMGAVWKFSKSAEQTMPSLKAIPRSIWSALGIIELLCSLGLILAAFADNWGILVPLAAIFIASEMLIFIVLHIAAGEAKNYSPMIYWIVVAAISAFIAYGRFALVPF